MKTSAVIGGIALLGLAACAPVAATGFNGDSVTIQSPSMNVTEDVTAEARRICQTAGRRAEYASSTQGYAPQYMSGAYNHLFLCLA